jgi:CHAT domain-containing protein
VTTNNGHIRAELTSPPPFGLTTWYVKNPEHPDEDVFVSVDKGVIDIQLDKEGKKVSGTINAQGKVQAGNRPVSTFSAEFSGSQQGRDLVEEFARYVGARPFDGRWRDAKIGKLSLHQQRNRVSGTFSDISIEESIVTDSVVNLHWKTSTGDSRRGFLSAASDGLLVGMTWNENLSFEPVVAFQMLPTSQSNKISNSILAIKSDAQIKKLEARVQELKDAQVQELKYLGYDLAAIGKHQQAAEILMPVVKYYHAREASSKNPTSDLINQALPLNDLISSSLEVGNYTTFRNALRMTLHVQNELQKSKADPRAFLEQVETYITDLNKSMERMENLKTAFDRGITMLSASGIGVDFDEDSKDTGIKISGVRSDMLPASRAGIVSGDLLVAIDGVSVAGMTTEQASIALRGKEDSSVSLKLFRYGQYRELKLVRTPLVNIGSEQREELTKSMTAIRDFIANTSKYYHDEVDKLNQLKATTDISVAFKKLTDIIEEHQKSIENQRSIAITLAERCLSKSPLALSLFQRFVSLQNEAKDRELSDENTDHILRLDQEDKASKQNDLNLLERNVALQKQEFRDIELENENSARMLKLDQEEEAFEKNTDVSKIDKGSLGLSMITVGEFDNMSKNARSKLKLVKLVVDQSPDAVETAKTLTGLATWLDAWRSRMVTDAAKIASLELGQDFYAEYVQALVEMNLPEQALQASESARARAFADLLVRSPSLATGQPAKEELLTSLSSTKTMTLDEIRQLVRDTGITVVEYFVPKGSSSLLIWVITPPKPNSKEVDIHFQQTQISQQALNDKVAKLVETLKPLSKEATKQDRDDNEKAMSGELKSLYDILITPIENWLPKDPSQVVTIVPHDSLLKVPFAALARSVNDNSKIRYLVEDHALTYVPSLAVLNLSRQMKRQPVAPSSLLAAIKPALDKDKFDPLPTVEDISKATINFYEPKSTLVVSDQEATQTKVLAEAPSRDVLLFYTHAKAIDKDPLASYIALTNNLLTAETIGKQHLNARLAILAACQTGRGEITGDGVQGVARMFMVAGAKTVMVSLWSVPQEPTLQLLYYFHKAWKKEKLSIAISLRQVQLELLNEYPTQMSMWAGFIIMGDEQ